MKHEAEDDAPCTRDSHLRLKGRGKEALFRAAVEMWTRRYQLTPLEATILGDAIHGFDRSEIAQGRDLSVETVKTHISHLLRKTGDDGLGEAARRLLYELVFECDELPQKE